MTPPTKLHSGQLDVWWAELPATTVIERLTKCLDRSEASRADALMDVGARARFVLSHAMLRDLVTAYLPWPLSRLADYHAPSGVKPRLRGPSSLTGLEFSVSASHRHVVVALARQPVGVDVQWAEELSGIDALTRRARDIHTWARAEAVVKLRGSGLEEIDRFVLDGPSPVSVTDHDGRDTGLLVIDLNGPDGYFAAVASAAPCRILDRGYWEPGL